MVASKNKKNLSYEQFLKSKNSNLTLKEIRKGEMILDNEEPTYTRLGEERSLMKSKN